MASKRLFGPAQLTNAAATKYTVPAGKKALIRQMHFFNGDTTARTIFVSVGVDAAGTRLFDAKSIPANDSYDWWAYLALDAAEVIQAYADVTAKVTLTIEGDEDAI